MRARIWGCRGSLATPGASTLRYGGNTSCVEVRTDSGSLVVLDAGTGIRNLGWSLDGERRIDLLLTHLHLDHVEGLGFFAPIFQEGCELTIWGPRLGGIALRDRIAAYLSPPFFPVPFEQLPSKIEFVEVLEETWSLDGVTIRSAPVQHPGGALGYRLDDALAFIPDNELGLDAGAGLALAGGADVLLHDAQYTVDEYRTRVGWGHSDLDHFARFVREAAPGRVVMFHHDPGHDDATLDEMRAAAEQQAGRMIELAHEGFEPMG
jgi:phosphoribosyl 1,2-cyclic phosphodiesterase